MICNGLHVTAATAVHLFAMFSHHFPYDFTIVALGIISFLLKLTYLLTYLCLNLYSDDVDR